MANEAQKRAIGVLLDAASVLGDPTEAQEGTDGVKRSMLALEAIWSTGAIQVIENDGALTVTIDDLLIPVVITTRILMGMSAALQKITVEQQVADLREWWDNLPDSPTSA